MKHEPDCQSHYAHMHTGKILACTCKAGRPEPFCNLCGLSCMLGTGSGGECAYGLVDAKVSGGYFSTAGNGEGALDDGRVYTFSLCEFCLDWLFAQFKHAVVVGNYTSPEDNVEVWRPAAERVDNDKWRKGKSEFAAAATLRDAAREQHVKSHNLKWPEMPAWVDKADGDKPLPEDEQIDAVHPATCENPRHDLYAQAMRLVGARRSKGGLVMLVHWLLTRIAKLESYNGAMSNSDKQNERTSNK